MIYRREIDGLRALAVVPVILFHAGFRVFSGGFVGVDVFFVISGYLITTIILAELETGTFSVVNFYERRARRILPALFVVMLACLPFAWLWLLPDYLKSFSQSLVAVPLFASNILFWITSGYFEPAAELKPLLHTWSLAVEEQYYVIFPLFLMLTWRLGRRWILSILAAVFIASLAAAQWGSHANPEPTFYLLPTRGWELLVGAFTAFYLFGKDAETAIPARVAQALSLVGLLLVAYATFVFDKKTPFPSLYALVPTVGTAFIILFATQRTLVGKLLGTGAFVGIGLLSYSAYLWHQPLFAFARHRSVDEPGHLLFGALAALSLGLAYLSWRFVETPFRNRKRFTRNQVFAIGGVFSVAFMALGAVGHLKGGFLQRLSPDEQKIHAFIDYDFKRTFREGTCFLRPEQPPEQFAALCSEVKADAPSLMIWGDSHAAALSIGLRQVHGNVIQFNASACPPIIDTMFPARLRCQSVNTFVLGEVARLKPQRIFLDGNWYAYRDWGVIKDLDRTIAAIRRVSPASEITIVGVAAQWPRGVPEIMIKAGIGIDGEKFMPTPLYPTLQRLDVELAALAARNKVAFVSSIEKMCRPEGCQVTTNTATGMQLTAFDYGHMSEAGSVLLAKRLLAP